MKAKIIIVIDHLGTGGAQQQVVEYLKYADKQKFDITVINLDASYDHFSPQIRSLGFDVIEIAHRGFFNSRTLFRLIKIFKTAKPDIVLTYLFTADLYGRLAAKLAGVKRVISSVRNMDFSSAAHHAFMENLLARFTDIFIINAETSRGPLLKARKIYPTKICLVHNGVDLRRFGQTRQRQDVLKEFSIPRDHLVVGMVGRLSAQKDYETFLKAAAQVAGQQGSVTFLIVGDGVKRQELESLARVLGIAPRVIFAGRRQDSHDLISAMDIGVLSSHYEGCPNAVMEYMACAKPVVASAVGGCKELIVDGETGFLVPPRDPVALAEKIGALIDDEGLRARMGRAGRRRVEEHFTSERMARATEKVYFDLIGGNVPA